MSQVLLRSRIGFDLLTHHLNQTGAASVSSRQDLDSPLLPASLRQLIYWHASLQNSSTRKRKTSEEEWWDNSCHDALEASTETSRTLAERTEPLQWQLHPALQPAPKDKHADLMSLTVSHCASPDGCLAQSSPNSAQHGMLTNNTKTAKKRFETHLGTSQSPVQACIETDPQAAHEVRVSMQQACVHEHGQAAQHEGHTCSLAATQTGDAMTM